MREFFNHDLLVMLGIIFVWGSGSMILFQIGEADRKERIDIDIDISPGFILLWPIALFVLFPLFLLLEVAFWPAKKLGQLIGRKL